MMLRLDMATTLVMTIDGGSDHNHGDETLRETECEERILTFWKNIILFVDSHFNYGVVSII